VVQEKRKEKEREREGDPERDGDWEERDGGAEWTDVTERKTRRRALERREESTAYFMGSFSGHIVVLFPII